MKKFLLILGITSVASTIIASAALADQVVKSCSTTIKSPFKEQKTIRTTVRIIKKNGQLIGQVSQRVNGQTGHASDEVATVQELSVRTGLTAKTADMNMAEQFVQSSLESKLDPKLAGLFNAGFDAKLVRRAILYTVGRPTHMGATIIFMAYGENGKYLGSALTGFFTSPCSK